MEKKLKFPVVDIKGHRLVSIDGDISYFYSIALSDLEQLAPFELDSFFNELENSLNNLNPSTWLKFYSIKEEFFLNTNTEDLRLSGIELIKRSDPLKVLFSGGLYTEIALLEDSVRFNQSSLSILSTSSLGDLNSSLKGFDYVLFFKKIETSKSKRKLESIRSSQQSSFTKLKKDLSGESSYFEAESLLSGIIHGEESLFDMELYFLAKDNARSLKEELSLLAFDTHLEGLSLKKLNMGLKEAFNSIIPGVAPKFRHRGILNKTSHLKFLLPLSKSRLMEKGIKFLDIEDQVIYFNPFKKSLKNRNMLVTGLSGSGKSVFVNKIIHDLAPNYPVVILDKGGSFKRTALYHEGVELTSKFNPFQFKDPIYLREIILSFVDLKDFSNLERGRLLKKIKEVAPKCISFKELIDSLENDFPNLGLYFEEVWPYITNAKVEMNDFLYVDIQNFPKLIITSLILYILEYFKNLKTMEKVLVLDEVWALIKDHGDYIDECFRTFRKTGAYPIAISQSLKDFDESSSGLKGSITNNSYFKVFFPQELGGSSEVDEFDTSNIKDLRFLKQKYSECYLKSTDNIYRKTLKITLSNLEYELFHTESGEDTEFYNFFNSFRSFFKSNKDTINSYIRLKYENNPTKLHSFISLAGTTGQHSFYARQ